MLPAAVTIDKLPEFNPATPFFLGLAAAAAVFGIVIGIAALHRHRRRILRDVVGWTAIAATIVGGAVMLILMSVQWHDINDRWADNAVTYFHQEYGVTISHDDGVTLAQGRSKLGGGTIHLRQGDRVVDVYAQKLAGGSVTFVTGDGTIFHGDR